MQDQQTFADVDFQIEQPFLVAVVVPKNSIGFLKNGSGFGGSAVAQKKHA